MEIDDKDVSLWIYTDDIGIVFPKPRLPAGPGAEMISVEQAVPHADFAWATFNFEQPIEIVAGRHYWIVMDNDMR